MNISKEGVIGFIAGFIVGIIIIIILTFGQIELNRMRIEFELHDRLVRRGYGYWDKSFGTITYFHWYDEKIEPKEDAK
jgi:hypothetical protein